MLRLASKLAKDESGGELLETAFVLGLIVVACLGLLSALGIKVMAKWQSLSDLL